MEDGRCPVTTKEEGAMPARLARQAVIAMVFAALALSAVGCSEDLGGSGERPQGAGNWQPGETYDSAQGAMTFSMLIDKTTSCSNTGTGHMEIDAAGSATLIVRTVGDISFGQDGCMVTGSEPVASEFHGTITPGTTPMIAWTSCNSGLTATGEKARNFLQWNGKEGSAVYDASVRASCFQADGQMLLTVAGVLRQTSGK
jgi:hypothetical protein